jgi:large subunit ribosomal protein L25
MEHVALRSVTRTVEGKQVKKLRNEGLVPAVLFGPDTPSHMIQVPERELAKTLRQAGSTLINLILDQEPQPRAVLVRGIQRHPITGRLQHVDFYEVRLTERVKTTISLRVIGESPLAKAGDALLNVQLQQLEVECLPNDIIDHIDVDVSRLQDMRDVIMVADLVLPSTIEVLDDPQEIVVGLQHIRAAEEVVEAVVEAPVPVAEAEPEEE